MTWLLLGLLLLTIGWAAWVLLVVVPVRRLATRQLASRRRESGLVIVGSILGTAMIVGSLTIGDTLQASIERDAYAGLGSVDEIISARSVALGEDVSRRLAAIRHDPDIDGLLTVRYGQASVASRAGGPPRAEPRTGLWEVDFRAAASFGGPADGPSGLDGPVPGPGETILNADLARRLDARAGDTLTFYLAGKATPFRVARVAPTAGLAGLRDEDGSSRSAFFAPGALEGMATQPLTLVSNRGGVADSARLSDAVVAKLTVALGPLAGQVAVDAVKRDALVQARDAASQARSLLLSLAGLAIIAGMMLLASVFVILTEDRTAELGMLRAIGMRRSWLIHTLACEGLAYALAASVAGVAVGTGLGYGFADLAARWLADSSAVIEPHVTPESLLQGFALGLLSAFATVLLVGFRIARRNVVAALHDLPAGRGARRRRHHRGSTIAAIAVLCSLLVANALRPWSVDEGSAAEVVTIGVLQVLAGVGLLSQSQVLLSAPFRRLGDRHPRAAVIARLASAHMVERPLRTGAVIAMYALVVFALALITVFGHLVGASDRSMLITAFGGYPMRLDWHPSDRLTRQTLTTGGLGDRVDAVAALTVVSAELSNGTQAAVVGVDPTLLSAPLFPLHQRLRSFHDDRAAWQAVVSADSGGNGHAIVAPHAGAPAPGTLITLTEPVTGAVVQERVAGVLRDGRAFRGAGGVDGSVVIISTATARSVFGASARTASALVRPAPAADVPALLADLQGTYLPEGMVGLDATQQIAQERSANQAFFLLLRGYLALGLLVGVAGLAVVMARAVRTRRHEIGLLLTLGFSRSMVRRSVMGESLAVALQGTLLGTALSLITSYQLFMVQPDLQRVGVAYAVPWLEVLGLVLAVTAVSVLVSTWPARRASALRPAVALRVRD